MEVGISLRGTCDGIDISSTGNDKGDKMIELELVVVYISSDKSPLKLSLEYLDGGRGACTVMVLTDDWELVSHVSCANGTTIAEELFCSCSSWTCIERWVSSYIV